MDEVACVGFAPGGSSSMPVLDQRAMSELESLVKEVGERQGKDIKGLIFFSHHSRAFLAGADINLIAAMKSESQATQGAEWGQKIFNGIEDLSIPTLACIHGVCLGGGCELVLACDNIYASDDPATVLALPEVKLGILPGFGGTYRMPRRVGLAHALPLILTGKKVRAKKALRIGLVDQIYPKENLLKMAKGSILHRGRGRSSFQERMSKMAMDNFMTRKIIFSKAREGVMKQSKGHYQAPLKILDLIEDGQGKGRSSYLAMEARALGEIFMGSQAKNLLSLFFLSDGAKKYSGPMPSEDKILPAPSSGGVLGAGVMGGGLAWLFAQNNQSPVMKDVSQEALLIGLEQSGKNFSEAVKKKHLSHGEFERRQRSITPTLDYHNLRSVDLLIEAVPENLELKKSIFKEVEKWVGEDCLVVSNTSSLLIKDMAVAFKRPERFAGLHFFNPVHRMPLVEIVTHQGVAPETIHALHRWVLSVKKIPLIVGDGPGFLVNRILMPYMNVALKLLAQGVRHQDIERACLNFGMPMGPFRLVDEVGIDVVEKVVKNVHQSLGPRMAVSQEVESLFNGDNTPLGKKSGKGFYLYHASGKQGEWNREMDRLTPPSKVAMDDETIQMRIFLPMINEAAYVLHEKIAKSPHDVDLGLIFGIGFPPFRGGLLRYADQEGLSRLHSMMVEFAKEDRDTYTPSPYLQQLVDEKRRFYPL